MFCIAVVVCHFVGFEVTQLKVRLVVSFGTEAKKKKKTAPESLLIRIEGQKFVYSLCLTRLERSLLGGQDLSSKIILDFIMSW